MVATASASTDPFQLERLAEELVNRELANPVDSVPSESSFPVYVPLSHSNEYLTAPVFDVDQFLISRSHTSLPELRSELRDYLSVLKEELVRLINDDYEAFISLSTDLKGEGARLERLRYPLKDLRLEILESQRELQDIQDVIQDKLQKRATLREEKALLHLLLKISDSVTRLESLLLITPLAEDVSSTSPNIATLTIPSHLKKGDNAEQSRTHENRAKHLARVASEYTQLLYHASKAREEKCAFVNEIQWRIDRVQSTLSSDLDHLFANIVRSLTAEGTNRKGHKPTNELEKAKLFADLTECLRTYDNLALWSDAEDVLRKEVMREFVKKTIFPGALTVPQSPLLPHTPFPSKSSDVGSPRTPYTPYSAVTSRDFSFAQSSIQSSTSGLHLLDDTDDSLAHLYNQILRFVERDLCRIMEAAERISYVKKSTPAPLVGISPPVGDPGNVVNGENGGFEIMANVIWAEFGRAIMDELGGTVFSAGRPEEFRKHHETTRAFLRSLELLAPSVHSVRAMRSHPVYTAFDRRWQLNVYFQLRWKEVVSKVEDVLVDLNAKPVNELDPFVSAQAAAIWTAISTCWSGEVYIPELSHRFWKLTLQLLSRYRTWLENSLPPFEPAQKLVASVNVADARSTGSGSPASTLSRAATPVPQASVDSPAAENTVTADDALLQQFSETIIDIKAIHLQVMKLWKEEIRVVLPEETSIVGHAESDDGNVKPEDALNHAFALITSLVSPMTSQIISVLTKRCWDALLPVRSVPSQFRAMSNKRMPTEPSYFVAAILRPVKVFFGIGSTDAPGRALLEEFGKALTEEVVESVCQRYIYYLTAMKKTEESLRRLKKGKKSAFSLFGSANTGSKDEDNRDEERIRTQTILDVEAFGHDAQSLGVDVHASDAFRALNELARAPLQDDA